MVHSCSFFYSCIRFTSLDFLSMTRDLFLYFALFHLNLFFLIPSYLSVPLDILHRYYYTKLVLKVCCCFIQVMFYFIVIPRYRAGNIAETVWGAFFWILQKVWIRPHATYSGWKPNWLHRESWSVTQLPLVVLSGKCNESFCCCLVSIEGKESLHIYWKSLFNKYFIATGLTFSFRIAMNKSICRMC